MISSPVVVKKLVSDFVLLHKAELDADEREGVGFSHDGLRRYTSGRCNYEGY